MLADSRVVHFLHEPFPDTGPTACLRLWWRTTKPSCDAGSRRGIYPQAGKGLMGCHKVRMVPPATYQRGSQPHGRHGRWSWNVPVPLLSLNFSDSNYRRDVWSEESLPPPPSHSTSRWGSFLPLGPWWAGPRFPAILRGSLQGKEVLRTQKDKNPPAVQPPWLLLSKLRLGDNCPHQT